MSLSKEIYADWNSIGILLIDNLNTNHHGGILNRHLTKFKHHTTVALVNSVSLFQRHLFKLGLLGIVSFILFKKDINIQLNLQNSNDKPTAVQVLPTTTIDSIKAMPVKLTTTVRPTTSTEVKPIMNTPSKYGPMTFILNPTYAKRKNIDPTIVAQHNRIVYNYIKQYAPVAIKEQQQYGIPASITLAQALLESNVGTSRLATNNNNHFGIKCFSKSCKAGHCSNHSDDSHKDFFRKYGSAMESYRSHSEFLQKNRYKHLLQLPVTDYKNWAHGLRKAGYATDKRYGYKLINIIEALDLNRFDQ